MSSVITWPDPTIVGALIGLGGVVFGGFLAFLQARRSERFQQKLLRVQRDLEQEYQEKEGKRQEFIDRDRLVKQKMLIAMNDEQRVQTYRDALKDDPRIAYVQIFEMSRPLGVLNIYVRLRLYQGTSLQYRFDSTRQRIQDPNTLVYIEQHLKEHRANTSLEPLDAISQYKRCIVVGDPGAGKTTLLKYLTLQSAENQLFGLPNLPLYIELSTFANSGEQDLLNFVAYTWDKKYGFPRRDAYRYLEHQLHAGNILMLLDALDETVIGDNTLEAEESYNKVSQAILDFATRYNKIWIVVTVRKAGYHQRAPLVGFIELEVLDFDPRDIKQFIRNWYTHSTDPDGQTKIVDLNRRLVENPRLHTLATNPLLLSLIVLVYEAQLDLPDRRAELYRRCVEALLTEWDAKRNIRRRREFRPEHKRQLLKILAWHFHLQGRRYFAEHSVLEVVREFLPAVGLSQEKSLDILKEIVSDHALLKEQAQGWHGFLHLTLQEYFVAEYASDFHQIEILLKYRADPWWKEVLLLYAGAVADASQLLNMLVTSREDIFYTNLFLAGECLGTHPTVLQTSLRDAIISGLQHIEKEGEFSFLKLEAGRILALIPELGVSIQKSRGPFEKESENWLGFIGNKAEVADDLLTLLTSQHLDIYIRQYIALALQKLRAEGKSLELVHMTMRVPTHKNIRDMNLNRKVRESIAQSLGFFASDRETILAMVKIFQNSDIKETIYTALYSISRRTKTSIFSSNKAQNEEFELLTWIA